MIKIIRTYNGNGDLEIEKKILKGVAEIEEKFCKTEDDLIEYCQDADAVICGYQPFTARVMDALPNLKLIAFKAIGYNSADLDAAKERGIAVTNIRNYCINEVADHTLALMLTLNRKIVQLNNSVHEDKIWKYNLFPDISRFSENIVGLLGFGNISRLVAKRLKAFDIKIYAYDPFVSHELADEFGVELVNIDKLLNLSDYISCHLPLNDETNKFLDEEKFNKMKNGVTIINTGRGGIIDEEALLESLDSGTIGYLAVDVLEDEYTDLKTHPFVDRENVIITPHVGFYSTSSLIDGRIEVSENILNYFNKEYSKCNIVNGVNK